VFPGVDLKSGVCYFLWSREHDGSCSVTLIRDQDVVGPTSRKLDEYDVFIRDERAAAILKKVLKKKEASFEDLLAGDTPFGLATNFKGFKPGVPGKGEVKVYASSNAGRRSGVMKRSLITKNTNLIDTWKVLAPQAGPGNSGGHVLPDMVLGRPSVAEPNSVCTQTWIVAGPLKSKKQAEVVARYLQTSFVRFIVSLRKISQHAMKGVYRWVPQQSWDQDWTDDVLYRKYGITKDEIAFINSMIRPMGESDE
jgi:site-specific DNA-methyltransferase (adenine-specific)